MPRSEMQLNLAPHSWSLQHISMMILKLFILCSLI